jgi:hypothetical protein
VRKIDELKHTVDHCVAKCDYRIKKPDHEAVNNDLRQDVQSILQNIAPVSNGYCKLNL